MRLRSPLRGSCLATLALGYPRSRVVAVVLVLVTNGMLVSPAHAAPPADAASEAPSDQALAEARQLFVEGVAAQDDGRYREALTLYRRAELVKASAKLLFNVGSCHEHLNELLEAEAAFEMAADIAAKTANSEVEAESRARLDAVRELVPHVVVQLPAEAEGVKATLDERAVEATALADLRVNPGTHRLVISDERHVRQFAVVLDLTPRTRRVIDVDLGPVQGEPPPPPPPIVVPERLTKSYVPALIAGGAAIALGGGALVTGLVGADLRGRFDELNASPTQANHGERDNLRSSGQTMYVANLAFLSASAIAAATAIYFVLRPTHQSRRAAWQSPVVLAF